MLPVQKKIEMLLARYNNFNAVMRGFRNDRSVIAYDLFTEDAKLIENAKKLLAGMVQLLLEMREILSSQARSVDRVALHEALINLNVFCLEVKNIIPPKQDEKFAVVDFEKVIEQQEKEHCSFMKNFCKDIEELNDQYMQAQINQGDHKKAEYNIRIGLLEEMLYRYVLHMYCVDVLNEKILLIEPEAYFQKTKEHLMIAHGWVLKIEQAINQYLESYRQGGEIYKHFYDFIDFTKELFQGKLEKLEERIDKAVDVNKASDSQNAYLNGRCYAELLAFVVDESKKEALLVSALWQWCIALKNEECPLQQKSVSDICDQYQKMKSKFSKVQHNFETQLAFATLEGYLNEKNMLNEGFVPTDHQQIKRQYMGMSDDQKKYFVDDMEELDRLYARKRAGDGTVFASSKRARTFFHDDKKEFMKDNDASRGLGVSL